MTARAALAWLVDAAATAAVLVLAWQLWERTPGWLAGTPLRPYQTLASVLVLFAALSALDWLIALIRARVRKRAH